MNDKSMTTLEYEKIKDRLKTYTVSDLGKSLVEKLKPSSDIRIVETWLKHTNEAKAVLNKSSYLPLLGVHDISESIQKIEMGGVLNTGDLLKISDFLRGCRKMKKFMKGQEYVAPTLSSYRYSITELEDIEADINYSIEGNRVSSKASNKLEKVRKKIEITENRIEQKLHSILSSSKYRDYIQESFVSKRNEKFVIPIKAAYKNFVEGNIIDKSSTGSTVFIEPSSVAQMSNELRLLKIDEEAEEYQILATITGYIGLHLKEIKINIEAMAQYDFDFAKGKYSNVIEARGVAVNDIDYIKIVQGRHPLIEQGAVPLDFEIGKDYRTLVITGPNTGGKTVSLKTIGLLTLMVQSGLHIPAEEGTEMAVFERIFTDIGDNQSIEQSLSTFSGHMNNVIDIMNQTTFSTLILLDEIGTGTDPAEGAGLAAAILDEFYRCGGITVVTTHYGEIKDFSEQHKGFENGCMEFEPESLKPLYKLSIGKSGKSNALWISKRLGMKERVLKLAETYINNRNQIQESSSYQIHDHDLKLPKRNKESKSHEAEQRKNREEEILEVGDSVILLESNNKGIVYETEDDYGNLMVLVNKTFQKVNRKRVKLYLKKEQLYPQDYDIETLFVPYKKRKLERDIKRGAVKNVDEFRKRYKEVKKDEEGSCVKK